VNSFYVSNTNWGLSASHSWTLCSGLGGKWYVSGLGAFCSSGMAVIDDFGNLVEVPA